jgi:hypothetical protein
MVGRVARVRVRVRFTEFDLLFDGEWLGLCLVRV